MQKCHVKYLKMNIWPSQVYLSLVIIQNFSKNRKKVQKKNRQIFPKLKFYYLIHRQGLQKKNPKFQKKWWFFTVIGQKLIYSPELTRRDPTFLKLFFVEYFRIWVLYLPKLAKKSSFYVVDLTKLKKKIPLKVGVFCLKTPQFQLYCFSGIL
jgi:hypothetical protein